MFFPDLVKSQFDARVNFVVFLHPFGHQFLHLLESKDGFVQVGFGILFGDVRAVSRVNHPRGHHPTVLLDQVTKVWLTHSQHLGHLR